MNKIVKYTRVVKSQASIKTPNMSGLSISAYGDKIRLNAINPVTNVKTTYLYMEIPKEDLEEVINTLKTFL
jgi:hypothetical protein